jgi:hypothetical protein
MANEQLRGVAPQVQKPVVPQTATGGQQQAPAAETPAPAENNVNVPPVEPMKDRTQENFEKLLQSNNQLFQQNQANNTLIQQLLQQQQQRSAPQQQNNAPAPSSNDPLTDFIMKDPNTGEEYIDRQKMQKTLTAIQQEAMQAKQLAQQYAQAQQQSEKDRQDREAFQKYPELNRQSQTFDRKFERDTRAFLTDSMLNPTDYGGRSLSFREAADLVRAGAQPTQGQVQQAATVASVETQQAANAAPTANQIKKEQAAASVANQPPAVQSEISAEQLQEQQVATRRGDDMALAARLMHTDHIFGPDSGSGEQN